MRVLAMTLAQAAVAAAIELSNDHFKISIDENSGCVLSIRNAKDTTLMNWINSPSDAPWLPVSNRWGLGYAAVNDMGRSYWANPQSILSDDKDSRGEGSCHAFKYTGESAELVVNRCLDGSSFTETYSFKNTGPSDLDLGSRGDNSFAIYTPINDHYTNSTDSLNHRAHAHIWARGDTNAWIKATRMGGKGPHLGLVVTKGGLSGYSIEARDTITSSNTRGTMLVHPKLGSLGSGKTATLEWKMFWHSDWDDFFSTSMGLSDQFIAVNASTLSPTSGDKVSIELSGQRVGNDTLVDGKPVSCDSKNTCRATLKAYSGEKSISVTTGASDNILASTFVMNGFNPTDDLIKSRVRFIAKYQQFSSHGDEKDGAYLVYDNDANVIVTWDTAADRNAGRERVGMGVLVARWLLEHEDNDLETSLVKYYEFVCTKLQNGTGYVSDRLYDYPWVMQLHLMIAKLDLSLPDSLSQREPIERFMRTARSLYDQGGAEFYTIGLPVLEGLRYLKETNDSDRFDELFSLFVKHGESVAAKGTDYPSSEVNYEQSIVAPAVNILLELYRFTKNETWLEAAKPQFKLLELFGGRQPDYHLYDISIRHWDGYWFGKDRMWGDTMPHYWSTLTAIAMHHYGKAVGDHSFEERAANILSANLANFSRDGRGHCAWIYPVSVDGRMGYYPDAYANDQDWALAHLLQLRSDDDSNDEASTHD